MKTFWSTIVQRYKKDFSDRTFLTSLGWSFALLILALVANHWGGIYAVERASNSVSDIVLSNVPVFEVDEVFLYGPLIFWAIVSLFLLEHPSRIPFALKSIALFTLIRIFFVSLTHIGPYPDHSFIDPNSIFSYIFSSGADFFFSGHTGAPFLMALVLWRYRLMRIFCIAASLFFGTIVLLGHLHYTIDVASAFFITYSIYKMAEFLFKKDWERFLAVLQAP